ncbi:lasso RiPP family leader peptide-containing protein [Nostoc sp. NIES-2111]
MTDQNGTETKAAYEVPTLVVHGSFTELTQGFGDGKYLDKAFPQNTPRDKLTFS